MSGAGCAVAKGIAPAELRDDASRGEASVEVRARVSAVRARQAARGATINALLPPGDLARLAALDIPTRDLLERAMERLQLSARAAQRILRVARTIADLAGTERIGAAHMAEAIGYRRGIAMR